MVTFYANIQKPKVIIAPSDPFFSNVVFLSSFEGADASTTFTDSSNSSRTITGFGNAQLDTDQFPTGQTSSLLLDGNGDYLRTPDSPANLDLGSNDFCMEFFLRFNGAPNNAGFLCRGSSTPTGQWQLIWNNDLGIFRFMDGGDFGSFNASWSPSASTWYHIAFTRSGNTWRWFIDGIQLGGSFTDSRTLSTGSQDLYIGTFSDFYAPYFLNGHLGPIRITNGNARYTTNFSVPTLPFPTS